MFCSDTHYTHPYGASRVCWVQRLPGVDNLARFPCNVEGLRPTSINGYGSSHRYSEFERLRSKGSAGFVYTRSRAKVSIVWSIQALLTIWKQTNHGACLLAAPSLTRC